MPTKRPLFVSEVGANFYVVSVTDPYGHILGILTGAATFSYK
jgi:hypothetical protein